MNTKLHISFSSQSVVNILSSYKPVLWEEGRTQDIDYDIVVMIKAEGERRM